jgi:hypothetical protein
MRETPSSKICYGDRELLLLLLILAALPGWTSFILSPLLQPSFNNTILIYLRLPLCTDVYLCYMDGKW